MSKRLSSSRQKQLVCWGILTDLIPYVILKTIVLKAVTKTVVCPFSREPARVRGCGTSVPGTAYAWWKPAEGHTGYLSLPSRGANLNKPSIKRLLSVDVYRKAALKPGAWLSPGKRLRLYTGFIRPWQIEWYRGFIIRLNDYH